jgi:two-component system, sensor histidine kinase YesM
VEDKMSLRNIKTKFFLVFIAISVIPIIIVTKISYNSYTNLVSRQVSLVSSNTISNSVERLDYILRDISRTSSSFQQYSAETYNWATGNTVADELRKFSDPSGSVSQYDLYISRRHMRFICENLMNSYNYINGIYIFTPGGHNITYARNNDLKLDYTPFNDDWYKNTIKNDGSLYISDFGKKNFLLNPTDSICFSRALFDTQTHEFLGVLLLDCGLDIFNGLDKDLVPNITNIYLVNENAKIIFDNTRTKIGQSLSEDIFSKTQGQAEGTFNNNNNQSLTVFKSFPNYNWKVVAVISINELNKQFEATKKLIIFISFTCAIIFIILSFVISKHLTRPITELSNIMNKNKSHRLVTTKEYLKRTDEVGILYTEYNNMINEINTFIKESYQNRLITLDSQMKALEAQINSHFLYNTLESINSIAEIEGIESIAIISKALGDMFRYAIKTKSELVSLENELHHAINYLEIQKIRYNDKFDYNFDIPDELRKEEILKLILQPLVENSVYHGVEQKKGKGHVSVRAWAEENLIYLEVADNGLGASPEQVAQLNKLLGQAPKITDLGHRDHASIGVKNVHSRIQLYYGASFGLTFESELGIGTKVRIRIPKH